MEVITYGTPTCVQCRYTKRRMHALSLHPREIDLSDPAHAHHLDRLKAAHGDPLQLPVVEVYMGGHLVDAWTGNQPDRIDKLAP